MCASTVPFYGRLPTRDRDESMSLCDLNGAGKTPILLKWLTQQIERQIMLYLTFPFTLFALHLRYTYHGKWNANVLFWEDPLLEKSLL
jgi:hypothetical protein